MNKLTEDMKVQLKAGPDVAAPALERSMRKLDKAIKKESAVAKVVKRSARLADMITDEDRVKAKKVITEAMEATCWRAAEEGSGKKCTVEPDYKTRLAAATLQLAYDEGLPVKRSIVLTGDFKSAEDLASELKDSPEALRVFRKLNEQGIQVVHDGEVIDLQPEDVKVVTSSDLEQNPE